MSNPRFNDLTGQQFERLKVIRKEPHDLGSRIFWLCRCDCGKEKRVYAGNLKSGSVKSCGCLQIEVMHARITHGQSRLGQHTPEYQTWAGIMKRCYDPGQDHYPQYGGRGIVVCERWHNFSNFFADMGLRPSDLHSIDRWPDNDGNYEKSNCRWATRKEQARNRRSNHIVEFRGQKMPLKEAAELAGLSYGAVWQRVSKLGWSLEKALSAPVVLGNNQYG